METRDLREKLIADFSRLIQDDAKLLSLDAVFNILHNQDCSSLVSDAHYQKVEESRAGYLSGSDKGSSWEEVEQRLRAKYGL